MKLKIIRNILAVCLVFLSFSFQPAFAADQAAFYYVSADAESTVNGTVKVTIYGRDLKDVFGYQAVLSFDTAKLEFKSASNALPKTSANEMDGLTAAQIVKDNHVTFAYSKAGLPGVSGNEPIAVFLFKAKAAGEAKVNLESINIVHTNDAYDKLTPSEETKIVIHPANSDDQIPPGNPGGNRGGNGNGRNVETDQGIITVEASVSETGGVQVELRPEELLLALQSVTGGTLQINVQGKSGKEIRSVSVTLPLQDILQQGNKIQSIVINTGLAKVTIPVDPKADILRAGLQSLAFNVSLADSSSLPENVRNLVQDAPVYDFTLTVDGNRVSGFNGSSPVTVEMPYALKTDENPHHVVVYYINDEGSLEVVKNGKYNQAAGTVTFHPRHFSKYVPLNAKVTFNDLTGVDWAKESIEALASREIIDGTGNGSFQPDKKVTRAEFMKMLINAFDLNDDQATSTLFDVKEGEWYTRAIASAQKLGIAEGRDDGSFGVNDLITRQDMAVLVYRAAVKVKADLAPTVAGAEFSDKSLIASYAWDAVSAMQKAGILNGLQEGVFGPQGEATRAEAAAMIYRMYKNTK